MTVSTGSLSTRIFLFMLFTGALIFIPLTVLLVRHNRAQSEAQALKSVHLANDLIMRSTRYSMLQNDTQAIGITLRSLQKADDVESVRIYGKKGVAYSSVKDEVKEKKEELDEEDKKLVMKTHPCSLCHLSNPPLVEIPEEEASKISRTEEGYRVLTATSPIYNSRTCSMFDCHPPPDKQRVLGVLETSISLGESDALVAAGRTRMIVYSLVAVAIIEILLGWFIWRVVHKRLALLKEGTMRIAEGDYDRPTAIEGVDEIGSLSRSFDVMIERIKDERAKNFKLIEDIARAVNAITQSQLSAISSEQAAGASEQVSIVQEVVSTSEEIAATADRIARQADSVTNTAEQTTQVCQMGKEQISDSMTGVEMIKEQVEVISDYLKQLDKQAQGVGGVIDLIEEISIQTNLLALNATIEAAGAGEAGKRFAVVAEEVKRLAGLTMKSTDSVRRSIEGIQASISEITVMSEEDIKITLEGIESVRQLVGFFEQTLDMVEQTSESVKEITLMTKQQSSASNQMVSAVREVEMVAKQTEEGAKNIEEIMAELDAMAAQLAAVSGNAPIAESGEWDEREAAE